MYELLQPTIEQLLNMAIITGVGYFALYIKRKWGIELTANQEAKLKDVAFDAVLKVEEYAMSRIKQGKKPLPSSTKNAYAINMVMKKAGVEKDIAKELVARAVAETRGIGATG